MVDTTSKICDGPQRYVPPRPAAVTAALPVGIAEMGPPIGRGAVGRPFARVGA